MLFLLLLLSLAANAAYTAGSLTINALLVDNLLTRR